MAAPQLRPRPRPTPPRLTILLTCAKWLVPALPLLVALLILLTGCTRTVYVTAETVRTDSAVRVVDRIVADTVRDTRLVWVRGDTVLDIRDREHVRRVAVHDTCYIERTRTVREPYPVERPLTRWEQTKMDLGGIALGAVAAVLIAAVVWLARRFRR